MLPPCKILSNNTPPPTYIPKKILLADGEPVRPAPDGSENLFYPYHIGAKARHGIKRCRYYQPYPDGYVHRLH